MPSFFFNYECVDLAIFSKFSWEEDEIISSGLKIIVLKNVFSLAEVPTLESESESFFDSLEKEIGLECQRIGGNLEKITIFRVRSFSLFFCFCIQVTLLTSAFPSYRKIHLGSLRSSSNRLQVQIKQWMC